MRRRAAAAALLLAAACALPASAIAEDATASSLEVSGVVELFTSQGCSSCPPADRVLTRLADDPKLVALAYHVDYWDYIGWKDPHGSRDNTDRQRAYASGFRTGSIYTPQVVVNGRRDVVGTREGEIRRAVIDTALDRPGAGAVVTLARKGERLRISADGKGAAAPDRPPVLMLVTFDRRSETAVDRGENEGQTLVSSNAVKSWRILGMWEGKALDVEIPLATLQIDGHVAGCAAILQSIAPNGAPGPILAAVALKL